MGECYLPQDLLEPKRRCATDELMPCAEIGHIKVISPGLAINLARWLWPNLNADERDYAILKQILVTLSILEAITMG